MPPRWPPPWRTPPPPPAAPAPDLGEKAVVEVARGACPGEDLDRLGLRRVEPDQCERKQRILEMTLPTHGASSTVAGSRPALQDRLRAKRPAAAPNPRVPEPAVPWSRLLARPENLARGQSGYAFLRLTSKASIVGPALLPPQGHGPSRLTTICSPAASRQLRALTRPSLQQPNPLAAVSPLSIPITKRLAGADLDLRVGCGRRRRLDVRPCSPSPWRQRRSSP